MLIKDDLSRIESALVIAGETADDDFIIGDLRDPTVCGVVKLRMPEHSYSSAPRCIFTSAPVL